MLDLAKLVFGGIILTGIMDAAVDKIVLFSVGGVVTLILCAFGYSFLIRGIKKYWQIMEFIYFLIILGTLALIGTIWNFIEIRKEDKQTGMNHHTATV